MMPKILKPFEPFIARFERVQPQVLQSMTHSKSITYALVLCLFSFACFSQAAAQSRTYTLDADFDQGKLLNLNHDAPNNDQLQLDRSPTPFPFINVAASGRGTVVRINTNTGEIIGEYKTAPQGRGLDPSRTTVDLFGNVWAGNRAEAAGGFGSVVKIGLIIGGTRVDADGTPNPNGQYLKPPFAYSTCVDRDGDGLIKTSRGLGNILPWPDITDGIGGITALVEDAEDECILVYQRVHGDNVRHVSVDANNNVWTAGNLGGDNSFDLLDGNTGEILASTGDLEAGGYGGLVDGNHVLWSANRGPGPFTVLRYDTKGTITISDDTRSFLNSPDAYGLGIDSGGNIWSSQYNGDAVRKFAPDGTLLGSFRTFGGGNDRGVAITPVDDHVWVANSAGNSVSRLKNDGGLLKIISVGRTPTGVAVDANGKVWVTNLASNDVRRIDPAAGSDGLGAVDTTISLGSGSGPYNYSDMTGVVAIGSTAPQGFWNVIFDGGISGTDWGTVSWNSYEPAGTSIEVAVRAADNIPDLPSRPFVPVSNGIDFSGTGVIGRYIEIHTTLARSAGVQDSPILFDLTVRAGAPLACEVNITSLSDSASICDDSVKVFAALTVTGGNPPYDDTTCTINGIVGSVQPGGMIMAVVPLLAGENKIVVECTVRDAGLEAMGRDSVLVFADTSAPQCTFDFSKLPLITGEAIDEESGILSIEPFDEVNRVVIIEPFTPGAKRVRFHSERTQPQGRSGFMLKITNMAGCEIVCDPIYLSLNPEQGPVSFSLPPIDRYLFVNNHGLERIEMKINQHDIKLIARPEGFARAGNTYFMPFDGPRTIDLEEYLKPGDNDYTVAAFGTAGSSADFLITDFRVDDSATGVATGRRLDDSVPTAFTLRQNYPNPFNPETRITFEVPAGWTAPVTLRVFNIQGQLVQTLFDGYAQPGQHTIPWNSHDTRGQALSSGVYFYQVRSGDFVAVRKMLLEK